MTHDSLICISYIINNSSRPIRMQTASFAYRLDQSEAFTPWDRGSHNYFHRSDLLMAAHSNLLELYPYIYASYAASSCLYYDSDIIMSNEGPQQWDPLG